MARVVPRRRQETRAAQPPTQATSSCACAKRPLTWASSSSSRGAWSARVGGPLAGQLQEVQKNDNASFLPASAESTEVNELQTKFAQTQTVPAARPVRPGRAADRRPTGSVASYAAASADLPAGRQRRHGAGGGKTVGDYLAGGRRRRRCPSQDGKASLVNASVDADSISKSLPDSTSAVVAVVETLRYHAEGAPDGLTPYVTGIGGIFADEFKVFGSLDTHAARHHRAGRRDHPDPGLPQPGAVVRPAAVGAARAERWQRRRLRAGQERRAHAERAEPGHPHGARVRRRDRLRAAPGVPISRGAAPPRRATSTR